MRRNGTAVAAILAVMMLSGCGGGSSTPGTASNTSLTRVDLTGVWHYSAIGQANGNALAACPAGVTTSGGASFTSYCDDDDALGLYEDTTFSDRQTLTDTKTVQNRIGVWSVTGDTLTLTVQTNNSSVAETSTLRLSGDKQTLTQYFSNYTRVYTRR